MCTKYITIKMTIVLFWLFSEFVWLFVCWINLCQALQEQLKQAQRLSEMYREQCTSLEMELAQIREKGDFGKELFKVSWTDIHVNKNLLYFWLDVYKNNIWKCSRLQERSDKMAKRLQLMTQRYEALEKRRAMEAEGYKTDLKLLRQKFNDIEKQIFKVQKHLSNIFCKYFSGHYPYYNRWWSFILLMLFKWFY